MFSKLSTNWGKFWIRPKFYIMKVLGRSRLVRGLVPCVANRRLPPPTVEATSLFPDLDVDRAVADLKRDGCAFHLDLPQPVVQEILEYARRTPCYAHAQKKNGFLYREHRAAEAKVGKRIMVGFYFNTARGCPVIARLERDPKLWAIARGYLGTRPRHIGNQMWWSFTGDANENERSFAAQRFHYDLDDYGFLKFFFYITDVDNTTGPHVCVRGTHRKKRWLHRLQYRRFTDEDVIASYGADNILSIQGPGGTGFVEDTFCMHKGTEPTQHDRLMLQLQFAITDYQLQSDVVDNNQLAGLFPEQPAPQESAQRR